MVSTQGLHFGLKRWCGRESKTTDVSLPTSRRQLLSPCERFIEEKRHARITGHPHKRRVWLFVHVKKCVGEYWRVFYRKLISRNGYVKAQNECKPTSVVVDCRFCGSTRSLLLITYSNGQRKTHQIAQIHHVESQKRQYKTTEVGLHSFWALT